MSNFKKGENNFSCNIAAMMNDNAPLINMFYEDKGKGKIKVYGVLTPVDIKDNKIKP